MNTSKKVFDAIRRNGLKLNKSKCKFLQIEITNLGHLLTSEGTKSDSSKIDVMINIAQPKCQEDLQRFRCLTNYS